MLRLLLFSTLEIKQKSRVFKHALTEKANSLSILPFSQDQNVFQTYFSFLISQQYFPLTQRHQLQLNQSKTLSQPLNIIADILKMMDNTQVLNNDIISKHSIQMQFLREFFKPNQSKKAQAQVDKSLSKLRIDENRQLPHYFHEVIMEATSKKLKLTSVFTILVKKIKACQSVVPLTKLFTIVFSILKKSSYAEEYLQELNMLQDISYPTLIEENTYKWAKQLSICCITYLGRVASIGDIYHRAMNYKSQIIGIQTMQTDLFRLLNVYSLIFPLLSHVTNTIGRYFKEQCQFYMDFYRTMRNQLFLGYSYMRYICNFFTESYTKINLSALQFFTTIIPQLQVLCDRMQDFFLNKYFKCSKLGKRLYFKEEQIQELKYFLEKEKEKRQGKEKDDDMAETADSQIFSFCNKKLVFQNALN